MDIDGKPVRIGEVKGSFSDGTNVGKIKDLELSRKRGSNLFKTVSIEEYGTVTNQEQEVDGYIRFYDDNKKQWEGEDILLKLVPITKTLSNAYI